MHQKEEPDTVAHYKTTNTTHHRTAGSKENAAVPYYISGATPGYKVKVRVSVVKGNRTGQLLCLINAASISPRSASSDRARTPCPAIASPQLYTGRGK